MNPSCLLCENSIFRAGLLGNPWTLAKLGLQAGPSRHTCTALGITRERRKYSIPRLPRCKTENLFVKQEKTCQTKL